RRGGRRRRRGRGGRRGRRCRRVLRTAELHVRDVRPVALAHLRELVVLERAAGLRRVVGLDDRVRATLDHHVRDGLGGGPLATLGVRVGDRDDVLVAGRLLEDVLVALPLEL